MLNSLLLDSQCSKESLLKKDSNTPTNLWMRLKVDLPSPSSLKMTKWGERLSTLFWTATAALTRLSASLNRTQSLMSTQLGIMSRQCLLKVRADSNLPHTTLESWLLRCRTLLTPCSLKLKRRRSSSLFSTPGRKRKIIELYTRWVCLRETRCGLRRRRRRSLKLGRVSRRVRSVSVPSSLRSSTTSLISLREDSMRSHSVLASLRILRLAMGTGRAQARAKVIFQPTDEVWDLSKAITRN